MLYGRKSALAASLRELRHPVPLVFSAEYRKIMNIDESRMVQFLALGLQIPAGHPDREEILLLELPAKEFDSRMSPRSR